MNKFEKILVTLTTAAIAICGFVGYLVLTSTVAASQTSQVVSYDPLLKILPGITFVITTVVCVLNLYLYKRITGAKEEVLKIVKTEIEKVEAKVATKEQLEFLRVEMKLTLKNIQRQVEFTNRDRGNERE